MGKLTTFLQEAFNERCPAGWSFRSEVPLLSPDLKRTLGYSPRVDVLLERDDGARRLWIEFEVSRADPVANHAKFATAHLFDPQPQTDAFVAMVSPHVTRGRRNLASNMVEVMRAIGMDAYQTILFPHFAPGHIKHLNHLDVPTLHSQGISVGAEIERVMIISEPALVANERRIHFAGDLLNVALNIRRWNSELETAHGQQLWGKRTVTYFAYDPVSKCFAPSKFCAYVAVSAPPEQIPDAKRFLSPYSNAGMSLDLYVSLDGVDSRFDGNRAWTHLCDGLGMSLVHLEEAGDRISRHFSRWLSTRAEADTLHPAGPRILIPPSWF